MFIEELLWKEPKGYRDWRLPENRLEAFTRVIHTRMVEGDLDHHHSGKVIADQLGLTNDQKVLYCLVFGQSYRNHWAMLAFQLWPDLMTADIPAMRKWHDANWHRMYYGNDTKWGVRKWPDFVADLQKRYAGVGLYEFWSNLANSGTKEENFRAVNKELQEIYGIGRMTAWLAQQTMYEFFHWDIDFWDQQLYDHGTWSQYDSLCYLYDRLDLARSQKNRYGKVTRYSPTKDDIKLMEVKTQELMEFVNERIPFHVDIYNVESAECEYRKTAYGPKIKEYTFWTTNELVEQYVKLRAKWADYNGPLQPDWMPYVTAFMTKGPNVRQFGYHPSYFRVMTDYGMNLNTHIRYPSEPNAHTVLDLPTKLMPSVALLEAEWGTLDPAVQVALRAKYDPVKTLQFKPRTHPAWSCPVTDLSYIPSGETP